MSAKTKEIPQLGFHTLTFNVTTKHSVLQNKDSALVPSGILVAAGLSHIHTDPLCSSTSREKQTPSLLPSYNSLPASTHITVT